MSAVQDSLFGARPSEPKRVADTSREAYAEVAETLTGRQLTVLRALAAYLERTPELPTAYELLEWMRQWRPKLDVNSVRPRLTEMKDDPLRFVEFGEKRKCRVSDKPAHPWRLTARGRAYLRGQR